MVDSADHPHPFRTGPLDDREHVRLPRTVLDQLSVGIGQQVRLDRGDRAALYTVVGTDDAVVVAEEGAERLVGIFGSGGDGPVAVDAPPLTRPTDRPRGTLRESLTVGGDHLVACAPHGGSIEPWTDEQAERLAARLGGTAWVCRGRWPGGSAFLRWHVTANDLHPASFPRLDAIADRGYDHAVAFHAWRREGIGVGGRAPRSLRAAVRDAIETAAGEAIDVELVTEDRYAGDDPENLVNWLTADGAGGIQLEQGLVARRDHGAAVVDGVAAALLKRAPGPPRLGVAGRLS